MKFADAMGARQKRASAGRGGHTECGVGGAKRLLVHFKFNLLEVSCVLLSNRIP